MGKQPSFTMKLVITFSNNGKLEVLAKSWFYNENTFVFSDINDRSHCIDLRRTVDITVDTIVSDTMKG